MTDTNPTSEQKLTAYFAEEVYPAEGTHPIAERAKVYLAAEVDILLAAPTPMLLWCPSCGERHIDVGEFATKVHHTHACQHCGMVWRPAIVATVGVQWLPGFKNVR